MLQGLLDLVYPPSCPGCRELLPRQGPFCAVCADTLVELPEAHCRRCAEPESPALCGRCQASPPAFARAFAPYLFGGALADAIHRFKYEDAPHYGGPLAALLAASASDLLAWAELLVPVPLHVRRLRSRGYDQALVLARHLARMAGRPLAPRGARRTRETESQVGKSRPERERNVAGAFLGDAAQIGGRRVLLVDDVLTTGATASAVARALLEAGAPEVRVVAVARAEDV